jgi:hypothetical protein
MPQNNYRNVIVEVKGQIGIIYVRQPSTPMAHANARSSTVRKR